MLSPGILASSSDRQPFNLLNTLSFRRVRSFVHIPGHLQIHPEVDCRIEKLGESERSIRSYSACLVHDHVDSLKGDRETRSQINLTQARRLEKLFPKYLSRMHGSAVARNTQHVSNLD